MTTESPGDVASSGFMPPRWVVTTAWKIHRALYRWSGGRFGLREPRPDRYGLAQLTTTGRRSGEARSVMIGYYEDNDSFVTMAMNGWAAPEPSWCPTGRSRSLDEPQSAKNGSDSGNAGRSLTRTSTAGRPVGRIKPRWSYSPRRRPSGNTLVAVLAQEVDNGLGDGVIDNIIISSAVHRLWGGLTVVVMVIVVGLVARHVVRGEAVSTGTRWTFLIAQLALVVQALLGIKLLDQGQGIVQLYIHYVGGLIPLGSFLAGGWLARGDTPRSARVLLILLGIGLASAAMAYFIGRAYVTAALG